MNHNTAFRRGFTSAVAATVLLALTSCGADVSPPSQDINNIGHRSQKAPAQPHKTSEKRLNFGDDLGSAKHMKKKHVPAGSGTRNRLNFGDDGV